MSHPQSYEILLVPEFDESGSAVPEPGTAIRSGVVAATGDTGSSGYPRYAGDGIVADIDPATRTVEALLVDGAELDYSLSVRIAERPGDAQPEPAQEPAWPAGEPSELTGEPAGRAEEPGGRAEEPGGQAGRPGGRAEEPGEGQSARPGQEQPGRPPEPPDGHRDRAS